MSNDPCKKCGQVHQKCSAHKRDGNPCGQWAIRGTTVCKMHGGLIPAVRAAGARRVAEQEAKDKLARAAVTLGLSVDVSPTEALLDEVRWTAGHVRWLRQKVQDLSLAEGKDASTQHPLVWGVTETKEISASQYPGTDETFSAGENAWYTLYLSERKHLVAVSTAAIKAGVEERRVRLAEQQGDIVANAIERILDALDLTPAQQERAPHVVSTNLRLLAGGAA